MFGSSSPVRIFFICFSVYLSIQILKALSIDSISSFIRMIYTKNIFETSFLMSKKHCFFLNVADSELWIFTCNLFKNVSAFDWDCLKDFCYSFAFIHGSQTFFEIDSLTFILIISLELKRTLLWSKSIS